MLEQSRLHITTYRASQRHLQGPIPDHVEQTLRVWGQCSHFLRLPRRLQRAARVGTTVLEIAPAAKEGRSQTEQGDKEEAIPSILSDGKSLENQKQGRAKAGAGGPGVAVKAESARTHSHVRNASAEAPAYPVP